MRKWYKRVTALVLAALMTVHHGGSNIAALAEQTGADKVHEDSNNTGKGENSTGGVASTGDSEGKDQQGPEDVSDEKEDTGEDQNADHQDGNQDADHQDKDQDADQNEDQDGQNGQNGQDSEPEGSQSGLNDTDSKADQNEDGTDQKDSLSDPSDVKQDGEKDQESNSSGNSSDQQEGEKEEKEKEEKEEEKKGEIPTATSSETSRQDFETDPKEADKQEKHTIYSWEWFEGEEYLVDGEQFITVNEGDNISADMIAETLPKAISATLRYEDATMWTEWVEDIDVEKWICDEYIQDENGNWPTQGEFIFTAVLPEEYELAEGTKKLEVKVTLDDPGVALLAANDYSQYIEINAKYTNGYSISQSGNEYVLTLDENFKWTDSSENPGRSINIKKGTWKIQVNGNVNVTGMLQIQNEADVTIEGETINVTGRPTGILVDGTLTIENKNVNAKGKGTSNTNRCGISVSQNGKLFVSGASTVTCENNDGTDLFIGGMMEINHSEAKVIANASNKGIHITNAGMLKISAGELETRRIIVDGGTFDVSGTVDADEIVVSSVGSMQSSFSINGGGNVNISSVFMNNYQSVEDMRDGQNPDGSQVILNGGNLTTEYIKNKCGTFTMNSGTLTLNTKYSYVENYWDPLLLSKFVYNGGTITGNGSLPEAYKIPQVFEDKTISVVIPAGESSQSVNVRKQLFGESAIHGDIEYDVFVAGSDTERTDASVENTGMLTITGTGSFRITVTVKEDKFYQGFTNNLIVVVTQGAVDLSKLKVTAYTGIFDGKQHPLVTVKYGDGELSNGVLKYAFTTEENQAAPTEFQSPNDDVDCRLPYKHNGEYCWVQVTISNQTVVKRSENRITVTPFDLSEIDGSRILITEGENPHTYNGKIPERLCISLPERKIESYSWSNQDTAFFYETGWTKAGHQEFLSFKDITDVGVYYPVIRATAKSWGYTGQVVGTAAYTVTPAQAQLQPYSAYNKVYDGTDQFPSDREIRFIGAGSENVNADTATARYDSAEAGERTITFSGLQDNNSNPNYKIPSSITAPATIEKAKFGSVTVSAVSNLIYNGEEQAADVNITASGITGESYSTAAGENNNIAGFAIKYGTDPNNINSDSVPSFKDAGTHTVYYEVTAANYQNFTGSFEVNINKVSLDDVKFTLENANKTYNGSAQAPTLKASIEQDMIEIPNSSYTLSYSKTDGTQVSEAVDAGTYIVTVKVNENDKFETGEKAAATNFVISPKALSDNTITVSFDQDHFTYNKQKQKPDTITVQDSETKTELVVNRDYTVTEPDNMVDAKTYEYKFTGIGNYQGTITGSITIAPKSLENAEVAVQDAGEYRYKASPWTPGKEAVTVKIGDLLVDPSEYQLEYKDNTNAGTAIVLVKANESADGSDSALPKNYTGSASGTFTIQKAPLTVENAVLAPKTYDGNKEVTVERAELQGLQGSDILAISTDYTAEASFADANAGTGKTYYVKAALKDTSLANNYQFLSEENSEITLNNGEISKAAAQTLSDINVSYSFGRTGEQTVQITGLPEDLGEFLGAEAAVAEDTIDALEEDVTVDGDKVIFKLSGTKMENIGKSAKITISNIKTANYENMTQAIVITMDHKKQQDAVSCSMEYEANADEETFTAVIAPAEGAEYSFDGENWSENNKKTDCQSDLEYTGYIRMKETEELYAGAISSTTVKAPAATVKAPVISPGDTYIQKALTVSLSTSTSNAVIYYTLDGTDPTRESNLYTGPFTVDTGLKVKAIAFRDHFIDSSVTEQEYVWVSDSEGSIGQEMNKTPQISQSKAEVSRVDDQKGVINDLTGIITGEGEGYSRWEEVTPSGTSAVSAAETASSAQWKLRYADGTYASGIVKTNLDGSTYVDYCWEQVNGRWYAFNADAAVQNGWLYDTNLSSWFYADANQGMRTGWQLIDGKWYYFHMVSDGTKGRMYRSSRTPDGYYVKEDGSWDEKGM